MYIKEKKLEQETKSLRRIFRIRWQQHVTNKEVPGVAGTDLISEEVTGKRWCWIGHVLRKEVNNDCAVALGWKPEGKGNRGRPKTTWRCTVKKERQTRMEHMGNSKTGSKQLPAVEGGCPGHKRFYFNSRTLSKC